MSDYWPRVVDGELEEPITGLPAICLEGPRGTGKTTTAIQRASTCFELDNPDALAVLQANPQRLVRESGTVVVDEWQRMPCSWDLVRRAVDEDSQPGRFILTGSSSPVTPPTHSGAGRIVSIRMRPLSLCERRDAPLFGSPTVSVAALMSGQRSDIVGRTARGLRHRDPEGRISWAAPVGSTKPACGSRGICQPDRGAGVSRFRTEHPKSRSPASLARGLCSCDIDHRVVREDQRCGHKRTR